MRATRSVVAALVPLPAFVLLAVACGGNGSDTAVEALDQGGQQQVELVTGEPFEATGVVDEVLGPRGFLLFDTLVLTAQPVDVDVDDRVRVVGEVDTGRGVQQRFGASLSERVMEALAEENLVVVTSNVTVLGQAE